MKTFYEMIGVLDDLVAIDEISVSSDFKPVSLAGREPRGSQDRIGVDASKHNIIPFLLSREAVKFMSRLDLGSAHIKNVLGRMGEQRSAGDPMLVTYVSNTELHYLEAAAREMVMLSMRTMDDELGSIGVVVLKSVEYARKISAGEEI